MDRPKITVIISHKHRFIFIKTRKTAGTSIEILLSQSCGPHDVITPISAEDERLRKVYGGHGPQNWREPFRNYTPRDWVRFLRRRKRKGKFYNHISAKQIRKRIEEKTWDSYYKFCFERNPWDKVISSYYWRYRKKRQRTTLKEFILSRECSVASDYKKYTVRGNVVVDHIARFESLTEEMEKLRTVLPLPRPLEMPRAKMKVREKQGDYRSLLSKEEIDVVGEVFSREIAILGYKY